jgi:hypothetical protein
MKKSTRHPIPSLPPEASNEEIIHWVDAHDVIDRLKAGVSEIIEDHSNLDALLEQALEGDSTAQLDMRIPPAMKAILTRWAQERGMDAASLARIWLAERIRQELQKG